MLGNAAAAGQGAAGHPSAEGAGCDSAPMVLCGAMGTSSYSSSLRNGGRPLRLAYPIHGKNTFRPSGNPAIDSPERPSISELEWVRRMCGLDTLEGGRVYDRLLRPNKETAYWDRVRFLQLKSLMNSQKSARARKRAENRERHRKEPATD
jgi:hypothetical protein